MLSWLLSLLFLSSHSVPMMEGFSLSFPDHPRLLFNRQDLPAIRERIAREPWASQVYEKIRQNADRWLERAVELPDRGSQWWHWYSCKKDGARLQTRSEHEHVCPVCGTVYTGYPYDDVILAGKHSQLADAIWDCGLVYQITGDARYAAKAKQILLAYAEKYLTYPLHNIHGEAKVGGGRVGPQSLDESTWLIRVAQGADLIWETLSEEEVHTVRDGLFLPAAVDVIQKHRMGIHNIQCWKNSAVGLTGFLLGDASLVWDAIESEHGYRQQMERGVRPDGPWFEGAWGYHFYTLNALWNLTEAAYHNGIDLYGPQLKRMFDAPIDFAMPNLHLPAFNDSGEVNVLGYAWLYEIAYARYRDPKYRRVLRERTSKQALLYGETVGAEAPLPPQRSRNYPGSGYAILTCGEGEDVAWLCLDYGPHGGGHGHPDKLNFVFYARERVIVPDPGTARYGVPIQREWYRQTLAHNTLTVDEHSQRPAEGECLAFDGEQNGVLLNAGPIAEGVEFTRAAILMAPATLLLVDQIRADREHTFDLAYHTYGVWDQTPQGEPWSPPDKPGYMHLRGMRQSRLTEPTSFALRLDDEARISVDVRSSEPAQVLWGTGVGSHTEDRVPLLIVRHRGRNVRVIWSLTFDEMVPEIQSVPLSESGRAIALRVRWQGGQGIWLVNPDREAVTFGGQTTREALVSLPNAHP